MSSLFQRRKKIQPATEPVEPYLWFTRIGLPIPRSHERLALAESFGAVYVELSDSVLPKLQVTAEPTAVDILGKLGFERSDCTLCSTPEEALTPFMRLLETGASFVQGWIGNLRPGDRGAAVVIEVKHIAMPAILVVCRIEQSAFLAAYGHPSVAEGKIPT